MKSTIQGFIFDLDGTLLDTAEDLCDSVNVAMELNSLPTFSVDDIKRMVGNGIKNLITQSLPNDSDDQRIEHVLQQFKTDYASRYMTKSHPYKGILATLNQLQVKHIKLSVVSNKMNDYTQTMIKHYFPQVNFVYVTGELEGVDRKPDPTLTLQAINAMDLAKEHILYVGDTRVDMQTAHNAGLKSVGVTWGFRSQKELEDHHADFIIHIPKELLSLL